MAKTYAEPVSCDPRLELPSRPRRLGSERASMVLVGILVTISLLSLLLLASESLSMGGLYLANWLGSQNHQRQYMHLEFYQNKPWARQYWKEHAEAQRYDFKPYVAWRKRTFVGRYVNIDPNGIRRTDNPDCSPSARQIWMFGASTLWGLGARDQDTIASILAKKYSKSLGPVCVTNFGESGWVSMQEIVELELALKRAPRSPNLVLFYDGFADASAPYYTGSADVPPDFDQLRQKASRDDRQPNWAFLKATNTYRLVQFLMDQLLRIKQDTTVPSTPSEQQLDSYASMAADNYLKNVRLLQSLSEQYDFRYFMFWQPLIYANHKPLDPYERKVLEATVNADINLPRLYRKVTNLVFSAADPHLVNLTDVFDRSADEIFIDSGHTNPIGNGLIAERMLETIRRSGVEAAVRRPPPRALAALRVRSGEDQGVTPASEH